MISGIFFNNILPGDVFFSGQDLRGKNSIAQCIKLNLRAIIHLYIYKTCPFPYCFSSLTFAFSLPLLRPCSMWLPCLYDSLCHLNIFMKLYRFQSSVFCKHCVQVILDKGLNELTTEGLKCANCFIYFTDQVLICLHNIFLPTGLKYFLARVKLCTFDFEG